MANPPTRIHITNSGDPYRVTVTHIHPRRQDRRIDRVDGSLGDAHPDEYPESRTDPGPDQDPPHVLPDDHD